MLQMRLFGTDMYAAWNLWQCGAAGPATRLVDAAGVAITVVGTAKSDDGLPSFPMVLLHRGAMRVLHRWMDMEILLYALHGYASPQDDRDFVMEADLASGALLRVHNLCVVVRWDAGGPRLDRLPPHGTLPFHQARVRTTEVMDCRLRVANEEAEIAARARRVDVLECLPVRKLHPDSATTNVTGLWDDGTGPPLGMSGIGCEGVPLGISGTGLWDFSDALDMATLLGKVREWQPGVQELVMPAGPRLRVCGRQCVECRKGEWVPAPMPSAQVLMASHLFRDPSWIPENRPESVTPSPSRAVRLSGL